MKIREAIHLMNIPFFFNLAILQNEMRLVGIFPEICGKKVVVSGEVRGVVKYPYPYPYLGYKLILLQSCPLCI